VESTSDFKAQPLRSLRPNPRPAAISCDIQSGLEIEDVLSECVVKPDVNAGDATRPVIPLTEPPQRSDRRKPTTRPTQSESAIHLSLKR
jgi:hypothetical protein